MKNNEIESLIVAAIVVEVFYVAILYFGKRGGKNIRIWYNNYKIGAYVFDVLSLIIGAIIPIILTSNLLFQIIIVIIVGLLHDLTFGYFITKSKPKTGISKLFYNYAKEIGATILLVDAILLVSTILSYNIIKSLDIKMLTFLGASLAYIGLYIVYSFKL